MLNIPFALCGAVVGPVAHRADDQPHDPGRPGAGHRHPGRRVDRRGREHPPPDGRHAARSPARSGGATSRRPSRGSWRCSASWPSSSRRSSCRGRRRRCSSRCRWPSASRWSPRTCSPAPSCRSSRPGCCGTIITVGRTGARGDPLFERARDAYGRAVGGIVRWRWVVVPAYLVGHGRGDRRWSGRSLGLEIFPKVDAGRFQLRMRAPDGTRYRGDRAAGDRRAATRSSKEVGRDNVEISIGYVGLIPSSYPINAIYQWTGGPEEAILRVALKEGAKVDIERLKERLRDELAEQMPGVRLSFEPADIVSEVMSFGSPTPVEVAVTGPNLADDRAFAEKLRAGAGAESRRSATSSTACRSTIRRSASRSTASARASAASPPRRWPARSSRPPRRAGSWSPTTGPTPRPASATRSRSRSPTRSWTRSSRSRRCRSRSPGLDRQLLLRDVAQVRAGHDAGRVRPLQHEAHR